MSFGLKISFGRICKTIKLKDKTKKLSFPIVNASRKIYDSFEKIQHENKIWYITPDGETHDDINVETEHNFFYFSSDGLKGAVNKHALTKLKINK